MEALEAVAAIRLELLCQLCHKSMREPQTFNTPMCGHTFCRDCVIATLEGPGIVKSQCPTCRQPAWKKDLHTNHKYTAIAEATSQLEAVLSCQGYGFGLFDGLQEPAVQPAATTVAAEPTAVLSQEPHDSPLIAAATAPPADAADAQQANLQIATGTREVPTADRPNVTPTTAVAQQGQLLDSKLQLGSSAALVPSGQDVVIPDSGSGGAEQLAPAAQANTAAQHLRHQPILVSAASDPACWSNKGESPTAVAEAPADTATPARDHAFVPASTNAQQHQEQQIQQEHIEQQQCQCTPALQVKGELEQQQQLVPVSAAPSHLQQLVAGDQNQQVPGHAYQMFQQLLANMMQDAAVKMQVQQQEQQLPPVFYDELDLLPVPMAADVLQLQQDLQHIDSLLHDIDMQLAAHGHAQNASCGTLQPGGQQQQGAHRHLIAGSCNAFSTTEDPTEVPSIAEAPQLQQQPEASVQQQVQQGAASGVPVSLGKRRRGRASGWNRAARAFSDRNRLLHASRGLAGGAEAFTISGCQLGPASGAAAMFSNCSGPLVQGGRPSLEQAFENALAAAAHAADSCGALALDAAAHDRCSSRQQQQQLDEQQRERLPSIAQEDQQAQDQQQQQQPDRLPVTSHQQQQQQDDAVGPVTSSIMVLGSGMTRPFRRTRARNPPAAPATSGSLTSGAEARRSSRRRAVTAPAVKAPSQVNNSDHLARSLVNMRVQVYWPADQKYYNGTITNFSARTKKHTVCYDDGEVEKLLLDQELWHAQQQQQQRQEQDCYQQGRQQQQGLQDMADAAQAQQIESQQQLQKGKPQAKQPNEQQQQQGLSDAGQPTTSVIYPADGNQPQQQQQQQQQQQPSLHELRQQLLAAKGLAQGKQQPRQNQQGTAATDVAREQQQDAAKHPQQQQQSMYDLQQQLLAAKGLTRTKQQPQQEQQQHKPPGRQPRRPKASTAARRQKRQRHGLSDGDCLSSSGNSLCASDITNGGDSAYEADADAADSSESDEFVAAAAAAERGAGKRGAVVIDSQCESDLEIAGAAASAAADGGSDSELSDSFVKQKRQRQKRRRVQARQRATAAQSSKLRQQQLKTRRSEPAGVWRTKQQRQQPRSRGPSEPPSGQQRQQQQQLLLSDSEPDMPAQPSIKQAAAAAAALGGGRRRTGAALPAQQQQQQQCDELLQQEAEAAWAAYSQQLSEQHTSGSEDAAVSDPDSDAGPDNENQQKHEPISPAVEQQQQAQRLAVPKVTGAANAADSDMEANAQSGGEWQQRMANQVQQQTNQQAPGPAAEYDQHADVSPLKQQLAASEDQHQSHGLEDVIQLLWRQQQQQRPVKQPSASIAVDFKAAVPGIVMQPAAGLQLPNQPEEPGTLDDQQVDEVEASAAEERGFDAQGRQQQQQLHQERLNVWPLPEAVQQHNEQQETTVSHEQQQQQQHPQCDKLQTCEPQAQSTRGPSSAPMLQQQKQYSRKQRGPAACPPGKTAKSAIAGAATTRSIEQAAAASTKYCDLLSDSMGTSSSSQGYGTSQEQNENTTADPQWERQQQLATKQKQIAAGSTGVVRKLSDTVAPGSKQRLAVGQRRAAGDACVSQQQTAAEGALGARKGHEAAKQPRAKTPGDLAKAEPGAAAAAGGPAADPKLEVSVPLVVTVTQIDAETADVYRQWLQTLNVGMATEVGKYTLCVVAPLNDQGCIQVASHAVLRGLVLGLPVVGQSWLDESLKQGQLLPAEDYLAKGFKGPKFAVDGGPARSLAAKHHKKRLFHDLTVVVAAMQLDRYTAAGQMKLAALGELGHACMLLQGPDLQGLMQGTQKVPISAEAAAQLCAGRRLLVVPLGQLNGSSIRALQQQWPTREFVVHNYLTDCICAYEILDSQPYRMELPMG